MMNKNIICIVVVAGLILMVPLVLTLRNPNAHINGGGGGGWDWEPGDFIVMGALLFGTGLAIDFAIRKISKRAYRVFAVVSIVLVFLLIWAEFAVGIFGTMFAGS